MSALTPATTSTTGSYEASVDRKGDGAFQKRGARIATAGKRFKSSATISPGAGAVQPLPKWGPSGTYTLLPTITLGCDTGTAAMAASAAMRGSVLGNCGHIRPEGHLLAVVSQWQCWLKLFQDFFSFCAFFAHILGRPDA